jgi:ATP-binding cassette subfamily F protein 3
MSIVTAKNLSKSFGIDDIFEDISLTIPPGGKIALVGPNGAGKTTLARLLIGLDTPSSGQIHRAKSTRVGYLPQNPILDGRQTIYEEMLTAFEDIRAAERELADIEKRLDDADEELLARYGEMQADFEARGGYTYETDIGRVLSGLGFPRDMYARPLDQLSGGQKTRALLARLLLESPDLLVLDEPTNHLDIAAIEWLENFLRAFDGAILMVSHDRYFMDKVVAVVWELEWGGLEVYNGNYSHYLQQREERYERRMKEYEAQQAYIAKEQDYIKRFIDSQNTAQAKGKRKRLERLMSGTDRHNRALDNPWLKKKPARRRQMSVRLQADVRTGDHVLRTDHLSVGYETPLFTTPDLLLLRGEVAAIIGPNGAGKSTFLKTILGELDALDGASAWGAQVEIGYFAQAHEDLNPQNTLLTELLEVENLPISEARNYLATYLFTGDDFQRRVSTLSGGERGRLALAKLSLAGANVLLLDEPTNHLDIASQEILQDVLANFAGTILLVSHDRYLIDALASQVWHITPGNMTIFRGPYAAYVAEAVTQKEDPSNRENGQRAENRRGLNAYQRSKRIKKLESLIAELESDIDSLTAQIAQASESGQIDAVAALGEQYTQKESELNAALEEWAELAD